jgi:hypothetical protein
MSDLPKKAPTKQGKGLPFSFVCFNTTKHRSKTSIDQNIEILAFVTTKDLSDKFLCQ